jgi:hypothetical protein
MKKDRFLIGILVGIGVLITAALVVFFIKQGDGQTYMGENTPDGTMVQKIPAFRLLVGMKVWITQPGSM